LSYSTELIQQAFDAMVDRLVFIAKLDGQGQLTPDNALYRAKEQGRHQMV
jgi:hypothetical protein